MNLVWATHHRAGAVAHVEAAATTHPAAPPPTHPAAVSTLFGSNTTVHPNVSCTLRPHVRISLVPCNPAIPHPYFAASKLGTSAAANCAIRLSRSLPLVPGVILEQD